MTRRFNLDNTVLITGFTALLYTWSTAHYHGFLGTLRLDADMMERSFHQVIYSGLLISFTPVMMFFIVAALILYLYSHEILPSYIDWARKSMKSKRKVVKFRRFWLGNRSAPLIELRAKALFTKIAALTFFGVVYIVSLAYFESQGKANANQLIENHLKGNNIPTQIVKIKRDDEEKNLRFLGCGNRSCAGMEEKTNLVIYYPNSMGYSYLYQVPAVIKVTH